MKTKLLSCLIFMCTLISMLFSNVCNAATQPLSENYYYPASSVYRDYNAIRTNLNRAGYTGGVYLSQDAYDVRYTLEQDAVFYIASHGIEDAAGNGGGAMECYDSNGNPTTSLSAEAVSDPNNYSLAYKYGSNTSALNSIRLAFFSGCKTGQTSPVYGNLPLKAIYYGALTAVGFGQDKYTNQSNTFDTQFFYWTSYNYDMASALSEAEYDTIQAWGDDGGVASFGLFFKSGISHTQYLTPAKYGNQ